MKTLIFYLIIYLSIQAQTGSISGVIESENGVALGLVFIEVVSLKKGTESLTNGEFLLKNIPVGKHLIRFTHVGYYTLEKQIKVVANRYSKLKAVLKEHVAIVDEVDVVTLEHRTNVIDPVSMKLVHVESIKKNAGAEEDVMRSAQLLPGVVSLGDFSNDLMVRGGNSSENSILVDGVEVPDINHFSRPGSRGGFMSSTDMNFIKSYQFYGGGYSAKYGNSLSSVLQLNFRDGNRESYQGAVGFSYLGLSASIEGPLSNGKGSWFLTGRRSVNDPILKAGEALMLGEVQGKWNYNLTDKSTLSFMEIFSKDKLDIDLNKYSTGAPRKSYEYDKIHTTSALQYSYFEHSKNLFKASLSYSYLEKQFNSAFPRSEKEYFRYRLNEQFVHLKLENLIELNSNHTVEYGLGFRKEFLDYQFYFSEELTPLRRISYIADGIENQLRTSFFTNYVYSPFSRLNFRIGLRADYYSYNESNFVSPRLAFSYAYSKKLIFTGSFGVYHQNLPVDYLLQNEQYKDLPALTSTHYILGTNYYFDQEASLNIEIYQKNYEDFPFSKNAPEYLVLDQNTNFGELRYQNQIYSVGTGVSRGVDVFYKSKLSDQLNIVLGGSFFRSQYTDLNGDTRNRSFDRQVHLNTMVNYELNSQWHLSGNWVYSGGQPYTPFDLESSIQQGETYDYSRTNTLRMPDYHSLNLRIDRTFYFAEKHLFNVYLSIWNVYNRKNIQQYLWNSSSNSVEPEYQFPIVPWLGMRYSF